MVLDNVSMPPLPTPIKCLRLNHYLEGYDFQNRTFLIDGFSKGFRIPFQGPIISRISRNHLSARSNVQAVNEKIQGELRAGRIIGPFDTPPFDLLICSPIAIVPKHEPGKFRLIHDLSFPQGASVNSAIPKDETKVCHDNIDKVVSIVKQFGRRALMAKTDIENAFRLLPIFPLDRCLLGFTWKSDKGVRQFNVDCCLPMGLSVSCRYFEIFSSALQWIMEVKYGAVMSHTIDDFFFVGPSNSEMCGISLSRFLSICKDISIPIKEDKTVLPTTKIVIYGIEVDSDQTVTRLPEEKVTKIVNLLLNFSRRRKVTLRELQSLLGLLNYATGCIVPGRTFLRRLYDLTIGIACPHYKILLTNDARADLAAWLLFMQSFNGRCMFLYDDWTPWDMVRLYTDAASTIGCAGVFGENWFAVRWPLEFQNYHINVLELFPIVVAVEMWGDKMANHKILFLSDNEATVHVINNMTSRDKIMMRLVRRLVVAAMRFNIVFRSEHIIGKTNMVADCLSRFKFQEARMRAPYLAQFPCAILDNLFKI